MEAGLVAFCSIVAVAAAAVDDLHVVVGMVAEYGSVAGPGVGGCWVGVQVVVEE